MSLNKAIYKSSIVTNHQLETPCLAAIPMHFDGQKPIRIPAGLDETYLPIKVPTVGYDVNLQRYTLGFD